MSTRNRAVETRSKSGFLWNMAGLTLNNFNSLFFLVAVKRINGVEIAGMFSYGYAVACLLHVCALFFNRVYQVTESGFSDGIFVCFRLLSCLLFLVVGVAVALLSASNLLKAGIVILLCLFRNIEALADVFQGIAHKNGRLDYAGKSLSVKAILGLAAFLLCDFFARSVVLSVIFLVIVNAAGCAADFLATKRWVEKSKAVFYLRTLIPLVKKSFPIFAFSVLGMFLLNLQKYVLGLFGTDETGALFNIIIMPATVMGLCGQYFINPFVRRLEDSWGKQNFGSFYRTAGKLALLLVCAGAFVCLCACLFGIRLMEKIYALSLSEYRIFIIIVIAGSAFYAISNLISALLTIMGKNRGQVAVYFSAVIVSLCLSLALLRGHALKAMVYAYFAGMAALFGGYLLAVKKARKLRGFVL